METKQVLPQEELKKTIELFLSGFIADTLQKRKEQILKTREWFKEHKGKAIDRQNIITHSWLLVHDYWVGGRKYEAKAYQLSKAGDRNYSEVCQPIEKQLARYKDAMLSKIIAALSKYEATDFKPLTVKVGALGLEGVYEIGNGRKIEFHAIMAGGWNIQCLHYRYTVNKINF